MTKAARRRPHAGSTPTHRHNMARCVVDRGWSKTAVRFQVDAKAVSKWRNRFLAEGEPDLDDRSSEAHRSPDRISLGYPDGTLTEDNLPEANTERGTHTPRETVPT